MLLTTHPKLKPIREKIEAGQRLSFADGLLLYEADTPLQEIGQLANLVRERNNGKVAYYNINTHLNPTNVCVYRCNFCAFRADLRDPKGYVMTDEQILERGQEAVESRLHRNAHRRRPAPPEEVRLVPEHHPHPARRPIPTLHLKAWTAVEINWFELLTKRSVRAMLQDMIDAGLGSMPGGGAEIFHPEVRDQICEHKADADNWLEIHRTAHQLGLRTNCTMLYGHIEQP